MTITQQLKIVHLKKLWPLNSETEIYSVKWYPFKDHLEQRFVWVRVWSEAYNYSVSNYKPLGMVQFLSNGILSEMSVWLQGIVRLTSLL